MHVIYDIQVVWYLNELFNTTLSRKQKIVDKLCVVMCVKIKYPSLSRLPIYMDREGRI
jgi:hypothetical protein